MELKEIVKGLHPLEVRLLLNFKPNEEITREKLIDKLSYNEGQCNQAFSWLTSKGLLEEKQRTKRIVYELTETGAQYLKEGFPEERLIKLLKEKGPLSMGDIARELNMESKDVGSAYGKLAKEKILSMDKNKRVIIKDENYEEKLKPLRELIEKFKESQIIEDSKITDKEKELINSLSRKRSSSKGVFRVIEREDVVYVLSELGSRAADMLRQEGITGEEIGALTPEILKNGEWRGKRFRSYNINIPPLRVLLGRKNPYVAFLEKLKNKLISLGFEEFDGPLVETEFWNCDALYMPQFHSARDIHDVYYIKEPTHAKEIEQPYLDNVSSAHENGWKTGSRGWEYKFDRDFTRRLILRSHGTVLSAKTLPHAKVPGKYFGVVRCFRYDKVDATHLADFYQTEGIVLGEDVNLRTLLGLLKMFAEEVAGATEVKYVPGYFPFTEPSVEVHIKHPVLGWFELGGSGIFRPEVTEPLGIKVPVLAWGLGIDRMALMSLGLDDLRELFSNDIEEVRLRRGKYNL